MRPSHLIRVARVTQGADGKPHYEHLHEVPLGNGLVHVLVRFLVNKYREDSFAPGLILVGALDVNTDEIVMRRIVNDGAVIWQHDGPEPRDGRP